MRCQEKFSALGKKWKGVMQRQHLDVLRFSHHSRIGSPTQCVPVQTPRSIPNQRTAYGDRSISSHWSQCRLILNTTADWTDTSRVPSCSTRVGKRITFAWLENAHVHVRCGG